MPNVCLQRSTKRLTQNIQGALVVRDDNVGTLGLQMLPTAHFKSKTQQIFDVSNHETDDPKRGKGSVK